MNHSFPQLDRNKISSHVSEMKAHDMMIFFISYTENIQQTQNPKYLGWNEVSQITPPEKYTIEEFWFLVRTLRRIKSENVEYGKSPQVTFSFSFLASYRHICHTFERQVSLLSPEIQSSLKQGSIQNIHSYHKSVESFQEPYTTPFLSHFTPNTPPIQRIIQKTYTLNIANITPSIELFLQQTGSYPFLLRIGFCFFLLFWEYYQQQVKIDETEMALFEQWVFSTIGIERNISVSSLFLSQQESLEYAIAQSQEDNLDATYFIDQFIHLVAPIVKDIPPAYKKSEEYKYIPIQNNKEEYHIEPQINKKKPLEKYEYNPRQTFFIEHWEEIFKQFPHGISYYDYSNWHNITLLTSRSDLNEMYQKGFITKIKWGKKIVFVKASLSN